VRGATSVKIRNRSLAAAWPLLGRNLGVHGRSDRSSIEHKKKQLAITAFMDDYVKFHNFQVDHCSVEGCGGIWVGKGNLCFPVILVGC